MRESHAVEERQRHPSSGSVGSLTQVLTTPSSEACSSKLAARDI